LICLTLGLSLARAAVYCDARGGCDCDCSWTAKSPCSPNYDDGTCCYGCCCRQATYCPSAADLEANGGAQVFDQGWSIWGGGGASTKSTFNLIGGSVEFDVDFSTCKTGVNCNIYTVSPSGIGSGGYAPSQYCDGSKTGSDWCVEVDWIESNGNCGGASTLHTIEGPGPAGCTAWGCTIAYHYNGAPSFHMRIDYGTDGSWTTTRNGQVITGPNLAPSPTSNDWNILANAYRAQGALIYSSQWVGWVPTSDCGTTGDLSSSGFSIKNLRITGTVVQGPTPTACTAPATSLLLSNW